jgi:hypothetical protein
VVVYRDPFSSWFWWWLLAQSVDQQARWAYHHKDQMDEARYRDLLSKNKELETKVKELEEKKVPRDPTQKPEGLDIDLMYTPEYVDAAYNPQPDPAAAPPQPMPQPSGGQVSKSFLKTVIILGIVAFVAWLVFVKRWGATDEPEEKEEN